MMTDVAGEEFLSKNIFAFSFAFPCISVGTIIFLSVKYSGIPSKSREQRQKLLQVNIVMGIWCAFRIISGLLYIFLADPAESSSIFDSYDSDDRLVITIELVILLLDEIICTLSVVDLGFITIF